MLCIRTFRIKSLAWCGANYWSVYVYVQSGAQEPSMPGRLSFSDYHSDRICGRAYVRHGKETPSWMFLENRWLRMEVLSWFCCWQHVMSDFIAPIAHVLSLHHFTSSVFRRNPSQLHHSIFSPRSNPASQGTCVPCSVQVLTKTSPIVHLASP